MQHQFGLKLEYSRGIRETSDIATLKTLIGGAVDVIKTTTAQDKAGVDYIAHLRKGAEILIDAKTREKGASRFWRKDANKVPIPELALEIWSVRPGGKYKTPEYQTKPGWTLSESSDVDMIYYSFDTSDSDICYLLPFQHLRLAFRQNFTKWKSQFKVKTQDSWKWESEAVFVPADIVLNAITQATQYSQSRLQQWK